MSRRLRMVLLNESGYTARVKKKCVLIPHSVDVDV